VRRVESATDVGPSGVTGDSDEEEPVDPRFTESTSVVVNLVEYGGSISLNIDGKLGTAS